LNTVFSSGLLGMNVPIDVIPTDNYPELLGQHRRNSSHQNGVRASSTHKIQGSWSNEDEI